MLFVLFQYFMLHVSVFVTLCNVMGVVETVRAFVLFSKYICSCLCRMLLSYGRHMDSL